MSSYVFKCLISGLSYEANLGHAVKWMGAEVVRNVKDENRDEDEDEDEDEDVHIRVHVPYLFAIAEQCDISNTLRSEGRVILNKSVRVA